MEQRKQNGLLFPIGWTEIEIRGMETVLFIKSQKYCSEFNII